MRKFLVALSALILAVSAQAQTDTVPAIKPANQAPKKKDWSKISMQGRANDHLMIQFGYDGWAQKPDSIRTTGFGRHFNMYFMIDFPFKTDPRFSVGIGAGVGSSNIYFDKQEAKIAGTTPDLRFKNVADTNQFKKNKLTNAWLEAPVELRYITNPENSNKSWKFAMGAKVGFMVDAHNKGKNLQTKSGGTINDFIMKESSRRYFNTTRLAVTARAGYGNFTVHYVYQVTTLIKENQGPQVHPWSLGLTISGL